MGLQEDIKMEEAADSFMENSPDQRERLLYIAILKADLRVKSIDENGCKRQCTTGWTAIIDRWTPAAVGTGLVSGLVGILEYFRNIK